MAHRGRVEYDLTDLLLLSIRGFVVLHGECLKVGLPGEKDEQRVHALIPIVHSLWIKALSDVSAKPVSLFVDCEVVQPVDMVVGEDLHKLLAVFCSGARFKVQIVEAAAVGGGQAGKFHDCGTIRRCRVFQGKDREILKVGALDHELAQWPLLESVLVLEPKDCELFEALLLIYGV